MKVSLLVRGHTHVYLRTYDAKMMRVWSRAKNETSLVYMYIMYIKNTPFNNIISI